MAGNSEFDHVPNHPNKPFNRYTPVSSDVSKTRTPVIIDVYGSISPNNLKVEKVVSQETSSRKRE